MLCAFGARARVCILFEKNKLNKNSDQRLISSQLNIGDVCVDIGNCV